MALSNESAGNGIAPGSALHHVPASPLASLEARFAAPSARVTVATGASVTLRTMLERIGHLAEQLHAAEGGLQ